MPKDGALSVFCDLFEPPLDNLSPETGNRVPAMNTMESQAKSRNKMLAPLLPLIILLLNASFARAGKIPLPEGAKEGYLYAGTNDSEPVIDLEPANDTDPLHPDFLYGPDTGHRVVEFYSPMCPHVRVVVFAHLQPG